MWWRMWLWFRWCGGLAASLCLLACSTAGPSDRLPEPEVDREVEAAGPVRPPAPVSLDAAVAAAEKLPRLRSLLVDRRGDLVLERYFNGASPRRPANIKSASKAVISALVGIAIERGLIRGVDAPIGPFFPKLLTGEADAAKQSIKIQSTLR